MQSLVLKRLDETYTLLGRILESATLARAVEQAAALCIRSLVSGGRVVFCGNGGSAADAQHLAAELSGRFYYDRPPLRGEALHANTSYLTAVANDYGYDYVFARQVSTCTSVDTVMGLSTSGNSRNIILAMEEARRIGMNIIAFTGQDGGKMAARCDVLVEVPSNDTPRIQEGHIVLGHILCELIEHNMFPQNNAD